MGRMSQPPQKGRANPIENANRRASVAKHEGTGDNFEWRSNGRAVYRGI